MSQEFPNTDITITSRSGPAQGPRVVAKLEVGGVLLADAVEESSAHKLGMVLTALINALPDEVAKNAISFGLERFKLHEEITVLREVVARQRKGSSTSSIITDSIEQLTGKKPKLAVEIWLTGALTPDKPNGNGHVYPRALVEKLLAEANAKAAESKPFRVYAHPFERGLNSVAGFIMAAKLVGDQSNYLVRINPSGPWSTLVPGDLSRMCVYGSFTGRLREVGPELREACDVQIIDYHLAPGKPGLAEAIVTCSCPPEGGVGDPRCPEHGDEPATFPATEVEALARQWKANGQPDAVLSEILKKCEPLYRILVGDDLLANANELTPSWVLRWNGTSRIFSWLSICCKGMQASLLKPTHG